MALSQNEKDEYGGNNNNEKEQQQDGAQQGTPRGTPRRPQLDNRGYTETGAAGKESPKLLAADQSDHVDRVSTPSTQDCEVGTNRTAASPQITQ